MRLERLKVLQTLIAHLESHPADVELRPWACPLAGELANRAHLVEVLKSLRDELAGVSPPA